MSTRIERELLAEARLLLSVVQRFHIHSVTIGKLEHLEESGIINHEINEARRFTERADLLCAEIDKIDHKRKPIDKASR